MWSATNCLTLANGKPGISPSPVVVLGIAGMLPFTLGVRGQSYGNQPCSKRLFRCKINKQDVRIFLQPVENYPASIGSDIEGPHYGGTAQASQTPRAHRVEIQQPAILPGHGASEHVN